MIALVWLIPAFPLAAFLIAGLFGRRWLGHWTGVIASAAVGLSALLSIGVFLEVLGGKEQTVVQLYRWIGVGEFSVNVAALVDPLSAVMLLVVTVVSFLIFVYSNGYMAHDEGFYRFFAWLSLFVFAMLILVMADNYLLMFVGWEGVGLCSYLLIGFWFERPEPYLAAKKAFVMNRIGDWGYTIGIITIFLVFGSMNFIDVFRRLEVSAPAQATLTLICVALFFGATGKSAQIPLYTWLPDAMEGPTPVSALIHAATMVTSGVYLVARSMPLFEVAGPSLQIVGTIGAVTAIFAATIALVQFDIKRVMAYSTVSQLGYMFLALGVGAPIAAIFHLATHAFFKALLFLGSGSVIHGLGGEQDMRRMGGLRRKMPVTFWTMLIAGGALAALPPLAGFWSKDEILGAAFVNGHLVLYAIGIITAVLTAFYVTRALWMTFYGEPRDHHLYDHAHESSRVMTLPLVALAAGSAVLGIVIGFPPGLGARARRPGLTSRADRDRGQLRAHDRRGSPAGARGVRRLRRRDPRLMTNVLSLLVVIPLAGLVPLFFFRRDERAAKQVAITTTLVELAVSLWMLKQFVVGEAGVQLVERVDWLPSLGISYLVGVDGISVLLVPLTTLLTFISVLYSSGGAIKTRIVEYMTAFLLLEVGMVGVFIALDLFLFYIFFELM